MLSLAAFGPPPRAIVPCARGLIDSAGDNLATTLGGPRPDFRQKFRWDGFRRPTLHVRQRVKLEINRNRWASAGLVRGCPEKPPIGALESVAAAEKGAGSSAAHGNGCLLEESYRFAELAFADLDLEQHSGVVRSVG